VPVASDKYPSLARMATWKLLSRVEYAKSGQGGRATRKLSCNRVREVIEANPRGTWTINAVTVQVKSDPILIVRLPDLSGLDKVPWHNRKNNAEEH
jgi:hypothetical protein